MAGKVNAEIVKITESMWLTQNSGGNKLVAYYPVTDVTKVLATEDGVSGDISSAVSTHNSDGTAHTAIQAKIGTDISTHNSDDTAHTAIQEKIGTDIGTHNSDSSAHTDIQTKIGTDIGTHNSESSAHTAIQTKIETDIGTHNSDDTSHEDIRTEISTHTGDSSIHLANADKIVVDADGNITVGYGGWAGLETDGTTSFVRLGTATQSYKFTATENGFQIQKLIDGDYTPVATVPTSSAVTTTVSNHNSSGTAHSDIRTLISNHTSNTNNPHSTTLAQLTGTLFSYSDGKILDSGGGYWSGGDSSAAFDLLTANELTTNNPTVNNTLTQKNSTPSIYFNQTCGSNGLPEITRKTPADSVPVSVGSPFLSGLHWGVADNTPVSTVKYDGTNPCGGTFRKFNQITSSELQFGANTNNRLYFPSSSSVAVGQRYIATCMFRSVAINGQTPPSCNYRLYLVIPTGGTFYVMTFSGVTPPAYNADGNSQVLSMEAVIDVLGVDASNMMFCMSSANVTTLVQPTKYISKTYSDANKPYFYLWASDTNINTTWECYLADMSLYRIK